MEDPTAGPIVLLTVLVLAIVLTPFIDQLFREDWEKEQKRRRASLYKE